MSWPQLALGDVCEFVRGPFGGSLKKEIFQDSGYPVYEQQHAINNQFDVVRYFVDEAKFREMARFELNPGDLIMSCSGTMGKVAIAPRDVARGIINQALLKITPGHNVNARFLKFWMDSHDFQNQLASNAFGAAIKNVASVKVLKNLRIPLPPLEEQKRIAGILDQADALRRLRALALDKLNTLGQAIFHEMFGDLRVNQFEWQRTRTLGEVAEVTSGITKGRKTKSEVLREVPYLAVSNVQDKHLKMDVVKTIEATEVEIEKFLLKKGDLLLTEGGDPDKLGRGTVWRNELPECIHQNHVFRVRVTAGELQPDFLSWQLSSPAGKAYFLKLAKQTTGIASINKTQLKSFPVFEPPTQLQLEFGKRLGSLENRVSQYASAVKHSQSLFASLQHRAFRGDL